MSPSLRSCVVPLVAGLTVLLLAGCGARETDSGSSTTGSSGESTGPVPSGSGESEEPAEDGPVDFTEIALISVSNAEGSVSEQATVLDDQRALDEFASQFGGSQMPTALDRAYQKADLPDGEVMVGAVVAVSCLAPTDVEVEQTEDGVRITADPVKSKVQCLVPVTTVALVAVPESAV